MFHLQTEKFGTAVQYFFIKRDQSRFKLPWQLYTFFVGGHLETIGNPDQFHRFSQFFFKRIHDIDKMSILLKLRLFSARRDMKDRRDRTDGCPKNANDTFSA